MRAGNGSRGSTYGSLHHRSFRGQKFVAPITPGFLRCQPGKNRCPALLNRAGRSERFDSKQRQTLAGQQLGGSRAARELHVPEQNSAQPLLFLRRQNTAVVSSVVPLTGPVIYEFRLAHK